VKQSPIKPSSWVESTNCAIEGILWAVQTQKHLRWHFLAALAVLFAALFFRVKAGEFLLLAFAVTLVLFAELINTALEVVVDLVSPDYHPLARRAKDVAAGSVMVASIGAAVTGYFALSKYIFPMVQSGLKVADRSPGEIAIIAVLAVTILVVLIKARFGTGTPLYGGMPSGHAAVAFSIATSVALSGVNVVIILLAMALATMVSHSRLLMKIHTLREVLLGAGVGIFVTLGMHVLLG